MGLRRALHMRGRRRYVRKLDRPSSELVVPKENPIPGWLLRGCPVVNRLDENTFVYLVSQKRLKLISVIQSLRGQQLVCVGPSACYFKKETL